MPHHFDLSVLDVAPVSSGSSAADALANSVDLARRAEQWGYVRHWMAEHHNTSGIASSVPAVLIAHLAAATERIRVGSGGVMLPNHSPLAIAEQFRLLETLHPGRIDLGIGRAPGTDGRTALALRRSRHALTVDDFPEQLDELVGFLTDSLPTDHPLRGVQATPHCSRVPPIHLLGSSGYSAQLAAELGLGFAFASHISPGPSAAVLRAYRDRFRPSWMWAEPHAILALSAVAAETDEAAEHLATSLDLAWLRIGQGRDARFPSPEEAAAHPWGPEERSVRDANRERHVIGRASSVAARIAVQAEESGADEVMVLTMVHDHGARIRSYELLAEHLGAAAVSPTE